MPTDAPVIDLGYAPRGAAAALWRTYSPEVLMEGPAGTGKTRAILTRVAWLCEEYPGVRALICRQTRVSCTESILVTLERDVFPPGFPGLGDVTRAGRHEYTFPNGSTLVVGGLDRPERLYSTEWDVVYVAEATEITEDAWEKFARAMRNKAIPMGVGGGPLQEGEDRATEPDGSPSFWTQRIADCNPGAPSHWLNQRCIAGRMRRLLSRHTDNPSLTGAFLDGLASLTGHRRARLYEGRWVSAEGSVYPEFDDARHVVDPFPIPREWPCILAEDPGYDHPTAIVVAATAPNGRLYVCAEISRRQATIEQDASDIRGKLMPAFNIRKLVGDPHYMFSRTKFANGRTIAMQMADFGLHFSPAPAAGNQSEIAQQVEQVRTLLTSVASDGAPMLQVFRSCPAVIRGFQTWSYVRNSRGEQPGGEDRFEDVGDDEMDAVRMIVSSRPTFRPESVRVFGRVGEAAQDQRDQDYRGIVTTRSGGRRYYPPESE